MRNRISLFSFALVCFAQEASFSGKWNGRILIPQDGGGRKDQPMAFTFAEIDGGVVGTFREGTRPERPIREGKARAGELTFFAGPVEVRLRHSAPGRLTGQGSASGLLAEISLEFAGAAGPNEISLANRYPPLPLEGDARSARILQLRESLAKDPVGTERAFWAEVTKGGVPFVEAESAASVIVTFLFHGRAETSSVMLRRGRFAEAQPHRHLFSRIPNTDIWFKTLRLIPGSRVLYSISENDPDATVPRALASRTPKLDSFNPKSESGESLLELADAPAQPWLQRREGVPKLTETRHRVRSKWLEEEREIVVHAPSGRQPGEALPVVYLFDGQDAEGGVFAAATVENLMAEKKIPVVVVVRVVHPSGKREGDLLGNENFGRFMALELAPFVQREHGVSGRAEDCVVGGKSAGGLAAAFVAHRHSSVFGKALIQSGAFWWEPTGRFAAEPNEMARRFVQSPKLPLRFYMEAGRYEVDMWGAGGNILEPSRHLRDVLLAKGYDVDYREFAGDHDRVNWRGSLADGLMSLLGRGGK